MSHPFSHPKGRELLKRVASLFKSDRAYIQRNSHIIFVCGGPENKENMRTRFCRWAHSEPPDFRIFIAEVAQKDLVTHNPPALHPIAEFEELISSVSDCILLFPESPGSYAELGYFASNEPIREQLLVANDASLQGEDSFIALGPIHMIDKFSRFQPTIQLSTSDPDFSLIRDRISQRIRGKNRSRFRYNEHGGLPSRQRFFCLFEIIRFFPYLDLDGIVYAYRSIFSNANRTEIRQFLSIFIGAEYVIRTGDEDDRFMVCDTVDSFIEFQGEDLTEFRLEVLDHYMTNVPDLQTLASGDSG